MLHRCDCAHILTTFAWVHSIRRRRLAFQAARAREQHKPPRFNGIRQCRRSASPTQTHRPRRRLLAERHRQHRRYKNLWVPQHSPLPVDSASGRAQRRRPARRLVPRLRHQPLALHQHPPLRSAPPPAPDLASGRHQAPLCRHSNHSKIVSLDHNNRIPASKA